MAAEEWKSLVRKNRRSPNQTLAVFSPASSPSSPWAALRSGVATVKMPARALESSVSCEAEKEQQLAGRTSWAGPQGGGKGQGDKTKPSRHSPKTESKKTSRGNTALHLDCASSPCSFILLFPVDK